MIKYRSYNKEHSCFFYFSNGRYYNSEDLSKCISERICFEFYWENAEMFIGLKDRNRKDIYEGDKIGLPYIDPMGGIDDKYDASTIYTVVLKHGCFGFERVNFQPVIEWLKEEKGEYVCNFGNKTIITDYFYGEVVGNISEKM